MSEDDKDAVIGKALRQYVAAKQKSALLAARIRGIGTTVSHLGGLLSDLPSAVRLEPMAAWQDAKKPPMLDAAQIGELLEEYHTRRRNAAELRKQLIELGIPNPDCYPMSTEEQYLIAGRALAEYGENRRELAALQCKAASFRASLNRVMLALTDVTPLGISETLAAYPSSEDLERVPGELQAVSRRKRELQGLLRDMGCEPKD